MARLFVAASNQWVGFGSGSVYPISVNPYTMAAWIYPVSRSVAQLQVITGLITVGGSNPPNLLHLAVTTGYLSVILPGVTVASTTAPALNQWSHVAVTFTSGGTVTLYLNGSSIGSAGPYGYSVAAGTTYTVAGGFPNISGFTDPFDGRIAEVGWWNAVLGTGELSALVNGAVPSQIRRNSLVLHWPLWGLSTTEADLSGNRYNGTATNGPTQANHAPVGRYSPLSLAKYSPGVVPSQIYNFELVQSGLFPEFVGPSFEDVQVGAQVEFVGSGRDLNLVQASAMVEFTPPPVAFEISQAGLIVEYSTGFGPTPSPGTTTSVGGSSAHGIGLSIPGGGVSIRFGRGYGALPKEA